jgi:hypothetical protein
VKGIVCSDLSSPTIIGIKLIVQHIVSKWARGLVVLEAILGVYGHTYLHPSFEARVRHDVDLALRSSTVVFKSRKGSVLKVFIASGAMKRVRDFNVPAIDKHPLAILAAM